MWRECGESKSVTRVGGQLPTFFLQACVNAEGVRYRSPGLERQRQPWEPHENRLNPERGSSQDEPLTGFIAIPDLTQGCRSRSNTGLRLANAFGVISY
jgi:hypothetical protein